MMRRKLTMVNLAGIAGLAAGEMALYESRALFGCIFLLSLWIITGRLLRYTDLCPNPGPFLLSLRLALLGGFFMMLLAGIHMHTYPEGAEEKSGEWVGRVESVSYYDEETLLMDIHIPDLGTVCRTYFRDDEKLNGKAAPHDEEEKSSSGHSLERYYGREVTVFGKIKKPNGPGNPGEFDYGRYLRSRGIRYTMTADRIERRKEVLPLRWKLRRHLLSLKVDFLSDFKDERVRGFLQGIVFGDDSMLSEEDEKGFRGNTTAHVLAVSGLHVGFLYQLLRFLTRGNRSPLTTIFILIILLMYGELTQWSSSTSRAVLMLLLSMAAGMLHKPYDLLTGLSTASLCMLLKNPLAIDDPGFVMSYLAVFGMSILSDPMRRLFGDTWGAPVAVQLSMIPYTAYSFGTFNPLGIAVNPAIILLSGILVPLALLEVAFLLLTGSLPDFFIRLLESLSNLLLSVNEWCYAEGMFSFDVISMPIYVLLLLYLGMFFFFSELSVTLLLRKQYKLFFAILMSIALVLIPPGLAYRNVFLRDEVIFLDVGQGDGIHVRTDRGDYLFDGGGSENKNLGERTLKNYFLKNRVGSLDAVFFTHMHTDHAKAAMELSECFHIRQMIIPVFEQHSYNRGEGISFAEPGNAYEIGDDVHVEVLWPLAEDLKEINRENSTSPNGKEKENKEEDKNETNTVYRIDYQGIRILITGDLLEKDEKAMVEYYSDDELRADVLKVAHHGSKYSSSEAFLKAVSPKIAVISVGAGNRYGHPGQETLERLEAVGAGIYRTDENGAVGLDLKNGVVGIHTMEKICRFRNF